MTKDELKDYLVDEAEYNEREVECMDSYQMIDAWLQWNGIAGYTEMILDVVEASGMIINDKDYEDDED